MSDDSTHSDRDQPVTILEGARFACQACGACCRSFDVGPIPEPRIRKLEQYPWPDASARGGGQWFEHSDGLADGRKPGFYMKQSDDGACVFLRADNLCTIHAELGPEAKPWMCRSFPYNLVESETGLSFSVLPDCKTFDGSFADGPLLNQQDVELLFSLMPHYEPHRFFPKTIRLTPQASLDTAAYPALERAMLTLVDSAADCFEAIEALRRYVIQLVVRGQDLEPQAQAQLCDELAGKQLPVGEPRNMQVFFQTLYGFCNSIREGLVQLIGQTSTSRELKVGRQVLDILDRVLATLEAGPPWPVKADQKAELFLRNQARLYIFQKRYINMGDLSSGLGYLTLNLSVQRLAAGAETQPLTAESLNRVAYRWNQFVRHRFVQPWLRRLSSELRRMFVNHSLGG